jgi:hypothetical protein
MKIFKIISILILLAVSVEAKRPVGLKADIKTPNLQKSAEALRNSKLQLF